MTILTAFFPESMWCVLYICVCVSMYILKLKKTYYTKVKRNIKTDFGTLHITFKGFKSIQYMYIEYRESIAY